MTHAERLSLRWAIGMILLLTVIAGIALTYAAIPGDAPFGQPLPDAADRLAPLGFGVYVTPTDYPQPEPERFTGYHAAVDYEIFPDELTKDVPVYAICDGEIRYADWVSGYGGTVVQECVLGGEPVTVLYGHVDPDSFRKGIGEDATKGDVLAVLAEYRSSGSDGTRKHLHLSIHRGRELEFLGYVMNERELDAWVDPAEVIAR